MTIYIYEIMFKHIYKFLSECDIIKKYIGKDTTKIFKYIHPEYAYHLLE